MKTLSQLIQEAIERLNAEFALRKIIGERTFKDYLPELFEELENNLKTELTNIVKESFKNTRVEEYDTESLEKYAGGDLSLILKYCNKAISDKQEKENKFLNN